MKHRLLLSALAWTCLAQQTDPNLVQISEGVQQVQVAGVAGPILSIDGNWTPVLRRAGSGLPEFLSIREFGRGRVAAAGAEAVLFVRDGTDNARFVANLMAWLGRSTLRRVVVLGGRSVVLPFAQLGPLRAALSQRGFSVEEMTGPISAGVISNSVFLIPNCHSDFSRQELDAIEQAVEAGSGLFMTALGWSWEPYNKPKKLSEHPMNLLGARFGIAWVDGYLGLPDSFWPTSTLRAPYVPTLANATDLLADIHTAYPTNLPSRLSSDAELAARFEQIHQTLAYGAGADQFAGYRGNIYSAMFRLFRGAGNSFYSRTSSYDPATQSFAGVYRERFWRTLFDAGGDESRTNLADAAQMYGARRAIFENFGVLLMDNQRLNAAQSDMLLQLLESVPRQLHNLRAISVFDFIYSSAQYNTDLLRGRGGYVNLFGLPVGAAAENGFPADVPPHRSDLFSLVAVHELNHVVEAFTILNNPALAARQSALIARAGRNPQNYLRSMFEPGFFVSAPQEFFASISNQYFANTARTLELALSRSERGLFEPLNQFLFFLDVYSRGSSSSFGYELDVRGNLIRYSVPISRDSAGRISTFLVRSQQVRVTYDQAGFAQAVSTREVSANPPVNAASFAPTLAPGGLFTIFVATGLRQPEIVTSGNWPPSFSGLTVRLDGTPVPLYYADGTQVNGQVPWSAREGSLPFTVERDGTLLLASSATVANAAPGLFQHSAGRAIVQNQDGRLNASDAPSMAGSVAVAYCTGLGNVDVPQTEGVPASLAALAKTNSTVTATVGGVSAEVLFSGLTPGFIGLYQVNLRVPTGVQGEVPLVISAEGRSSQPGTLSVR